MLKRFQLPFFSLLIILTLLTTVTTVTTFASLPKPSVPEFSIELIDNSYYLPVTQSVDPYTGEIVTHPSHRVVNKTIEVTINNQAFASRLLYNIRVKGHFSEFWTEVYHPSDGFPIQSDSEYTVVTYNCTGEKDFYGSYSATIQAPSGSQIDFQVQAMNGHISRNVSIPAPGTGWAFLGETSDWSDTQTLLIPNDNSSSPSSSPNDIGTPSHNPTATPLQPNVGSSVLFNLDWVGIAVIALLAVVALLLVVVVVYLQRKSVRQTARN